MKNYKMVDPTPAQAGGFGAIAGASMGATSVAGALIGGAVGFASGAIAGGLVARKDRMMAKEENPGLRNKTQFPDLIEGPTVNLKDVKSSYKGMK